MMHTVEALRERNEILEEENRQLREKLAPRVEFPPEWKLPRQLGVVLRVLYGRRAPMSRTAICMAVWGFDRPGVDDKAVEVMIWRLRKRLAAVDPRLKVEVSRGVGYYLTDEARAVIAEALGQ